MGIDEIGVGYEWEQTDGDGLGMGIMRGHKVGRGQTDTNGVDGAKLSPCNSLALNVGDKRPSPSRTSLSNILWSG